ncbi:MAG: phosphoserine phosphatase SerB [Geminicoccaceae bacterium]
MRTAALLIAAPGAGVLDARVAAAATRALAGEAAWLAEGDALEIATDLEPAEAEQRLREVAGERPVDIAAVVSEGRRKRLLISDMDSTMITIECIDELADYAGIKAEIAAITRRAMNGEIEFRGALVERVALLGGLPVALIDEIIRERLRLMPGATTLVRTMRAKGARCVLVSGGFTAFTAFVRDRLGFHLDEANELETAGGVLTGRLAGEIRDASSKLDALKRHTGELGAGPDAALAVGDGANDLPMILAAGMGVAFRAHPRVEAQAPLRIRHADLTALLYLQGYPQAEHVTG